MPEYQRLNYLFLGRVGCHTEYLLNFKRGVVTITYEDMQTFQGTSSLVVQQRAEHEWQAVLDLSVTSSAPLC